jgi:hypothetical protein
VVDECVGAIKRAGACAALPGDIENLADCPSDPPVTAGTELTKVCDVVKKPEKIIECDFLYKPVELPESGPDTSGEDTGSEAEADGGQESGSDDAALE